ncbi:hypothetical protein CJD36_001595 [Flavipsychrobacter stenotrophus]|uniref:PhnB-like domain-containing protein n=1 Tax=Flavipsychrobacter stenotrophus TaxID=2077091 RepID=A0A2S7T0L3_9BACT|nr:VOC family protein [Flavipsychrobacter stenotrophus]PQJ12468.1 hypothetical protein CJD36_001595 [Flavipsychrobacter stenotrophus]
MQKITPFLWYNGKAEDAAKLYTSIFKNSKMLGSNPMSATVEVEGQTLILFNGGPMYELNPSFSLSVSCDTQAEIDEYWEKLLANGGKESRCGWLVDKFGLSWQIVPSKLGSLIGGPDGAGANRAMKAMMKMNKMDIQTLQDAYNNK